MIEEKRQFHRVAFDTEALFYSGDQPHVCKIADISIHGVLIELTKPAQIDKDSELKLEIPLDDGAHCITMMLNLKNQRGNSIGLSCAHIDLESISLLRRLVELNLGKPEALERDFASLVKDNSN